MNSTTKTSRTRRKARAGDSALRSYCVLAVLAIAVALAATSSAYAQGGTTRYVYDDNGRLRAVIAPSGEANIYEYDAAGNFTAIRRNTANTLEALDFTPREGAPGTQVTIVGTGFGGGVNAVAFNGMAAQIVSANAPVVVVTVPSGATTGPISVTTPGGTATTALPFTVGGINVTPPAVAVQSEQTVQFTATVVLSGDQSVVWSVDGIEGGSSIVGTITADGLYTAPRLLPSQPSAIFRVRATSVSEIAVYGEAVVTVKNPEFIRPAFAQAVSVRNGNPSNNTPLYGAAVSVRNGNPSNNTPLYGAAVSVRNGNPSNNTPLYSSAVSVRNGNPSNNTPLYGAAISIRNGNPSNNTPLYSAAISVRNGNPSNATPLYSSGVSVRNGAESNNTAIYGAPVSVTNGPSISTIAPGQASRGQATNITISGANLSGTTALTLFDIANGVFDTNITVSNLNVNGAGTSLTATLTVSGTAALGRRVVIVTASGKSSPMTDAGANTIEVIP
jgi:YD repeat-containing protein